MTRRRSMQPKLAYCPGLLESRPRRGLRRLAVMLALSLLAGGCSWFSWVPGIGGKDEKKEALEPAKLVDFVAEAQIERRWRASIGAGLGRKYLRLNPVIVADRIYAADGYGVVEARDRFSGKRVWRTEIGKARKGRSGRFRMIPRLVFLTAEMSASSAAALAPEMALCSWEPRTANWWPSPLLTAASSGGPMWAARFSAGRQSATAPCWFKPSTDGC